MSTYYIPRFTNRTATKVYKELVRRLEIDTHLNEIAERDPAGGFARGRKRELENLLDWMRIAFPGRKTKE